VKFKELFKNKYLKRFILARFISNFGNGMSPIALAFGILHLPNGSANVLGLVLGSATVAMLVMSPFGGAIADKFGQVRVSGLVDIWASLGLFVQVAFFATGHVPLAVMLFANINFGLMWGIFWPAMSGVLPAIVPDEQLQTGNAVNQFFQNGAMILGAATGGIIVSQIGSTWALGIDAATFFIAGLLVFSFGHIVPRREANENSMLDDLKHGWKTFLSYRWIVSGVLGFSLIVLAWAAGQEILGPIISLKHFDGAKSWSIVLTAESIGYVIGSLTAMKIKPKHPLRFLLSISFSMPIFLWSLSRPQPLWFIAACALAWGVTLDLWSSLWSTAMQREVPREVLSRVSAFDAMGTMMFRPVGLAIAGPLSLLLGVPHTLQVLALLCVIMIGVMFAIPEMRNMQMKSTSQETLT
jgi:MFS family permease